MSTITEVWKKLITSQDDLDGSGLMEEVIADVVKIARDYN